MQSEGLKFYALVMVWGLWEMNRWTDEGRALGSGIEEGPGELAEPLCHESLQQDVPLDQEANFACHHSSTLKWDLPASRIIRNNFLLLVNYTVCDILL